MKTKTIASILSSIIVLNTLISLPAKAVTYTRLVDNDPIAPGNSFSQDNMAYYSGMPGCYNNDMRMSPYIYSGFADATWEFPQIVYNATTCNVSLDVWLNNANFTDPEAAYDIQVAINGVGKPIDTLNQKYADAGWNNISNTVTAYANNTSILCSYVTVSASSGSYKHLGADAIDLSVVF